MHIDRVASRVYPEAQDSSGGTEMWRPSSLMRQFLNNSSPKSDEESDKIPGAVSFRPFRPRWSGSAF